MECDTNVPSEAEYYIPIDGRSARKREVWLARTSALRALDHVFEHCVDCEVVVMFMVLAMRTVALSMRKVRYSNCNSGSDRDANPASNRLIGKEAQSDIRQMDAGMRKICRCFGISTSRFRRRPAFCPCPGAGVGW